ncbi:hypothetical protein G7051_03980 [Dysgonomonas sp. HDW5B]|nr:hypothetical protein [Dysgonomonas sp. HDW5B]QIK53551.1 hypothetical protein G7051_03980 [Dysgonomonas sp. HDW5B]
MREYYEKVISGYQKLDAHFSQFPSKPNHWINMFYLRYHYIKSFKIESDK